MTAVGAQRHALADRGDDLYETPPIAVEKLLLVERLPLFIWEPACGRGAIVRVLRKAHRRVHASDLIDYKTGDQDQVQDFFAFKEAPERTEAILTNPPFKDAERFVEHALTLCPEVIVLLRLAFLESEKRSKLLDKGKLAKVLVFKSRLPMMHRDGWEGRRATSSVAFAWFWWRLKHTGPALLHRL